VWVLWELRRSAENKSPGMSVCRKLYVGNCCVLVLMLVLMLLSLMVLGASLYTPFP